MIHVIRTLVHVWAWGVPFGVILSLYVQRMTIRHARRYPTTFNPWQYMVLFGLCEAIWIGSLCLFLLAVIFDWIYYFFS